MFREIVSCLLRMRGRGGGWWRIFRDFLKIYFINKTLRYTPGLLFYFAKVIETANLSPPSSPPFCPECSAAGRENAVLRMLFAPFGDGVGDVPFPQARAARPRLSMVRPLRGRECVSACLSSSVYTYIIYKELSGRIMYIICQDARILSVYRGLRSCPTMPNRGRAARACGYGCMLILIRDKKGEFLPSPVLKYGCMLILIRASEKSKARVWCVDVVRPLRGRDSVGLSLSAGSLRSPAVRHGRASPRP